MRQRLNPKSAKDTHFTSTLAQHVAESESISNNGANDGVIDSITLQADQNLAWDIYLWRTSDYNDSDMDVASPCGFTTFATTDGLQISATGQYFYSKQNLNIPYRDADGTGKVHVSLVNRSATAKNAGATGEVVVEFGFTTNDY